MRKMFTRLFGLTLLMFLAGSYAVLKAQEPCDIQPVTIDNVTLLTDITAKCDSDLIQYEVTGYPAGAEFSFSYDVDPPVFGAFTAESTIWVKEGLGFSVIVRLNETCQTAPYYYPGDDIIQPVSIDGVVTISPTCTGNNDGVINISASAGEGRVLEYSINGGASWYVQHYFSVPVGIYTVAVRDSHCRDYVVTKTVQVDGLADNLIDLNEAESDLLNDCANTINAYIKIDTLTWAHQTGFDDRTITYYLTDGVTNWTSADGLFSDLEAGVYSAWAEDDLGCSSNRIESIIVETNPPLVVNASVTDNTACFGYTDATITITIEGGTGPFLFGHANTLPAVLNLSEASMGSWDGEGSVEIQVSGSPDSITYWVVVKDLACGNMVSNDSPLKVGSYYPVAIQKEEESVSPVSCFGDTDGEIVVAEATGGSGELVYTLQILNGADWENVVGWENKETTTFTGLAVGTYRVVVTDLNGCKGDETDEILLGGPDAPVAIDEFTYSDITCTGAADGTITVVAGGGSGAYDIKVGDNEWEAFPEGSNTTVITIATESEVEVTVRDANQPVCMSDPETASINEPDPLVIDAFRIVEGAFLCSEVEEDNIEVLASGGTGPYTYELWMNGDSLDTSSENTFLVENGNTYQVIVRDQYCSVTSNELEIVPADSIIWSWVDVTCSGDTAGSIRVTATGQAGRSYKAMWKQVGEGAAADEGASVWFTGSFDLDQVIQFETNELISSEYEITIVDSEGCFAAFVDTIVMEQVVLEEVQLQITEGDVVNCGTEVTIGVTGGVAPYIVLVDGIVRTETTVVLNGGAHKIEVTDSHLRCGDVEEFILDYPVSMDTTIWAGVDGTAAYVNAEAGLDTTLVVDDHYFHPTIDGCMLELKVTVLQGEAPVLDTVSPMGNIQDNHPVFEITFENDVTFNQTGYLTVTDKVTGAVALTLEITPAMVSGNTITITYDHLVSGGLNKFTTYVVTVDSAVVKGIGLVWDGQIPYAWEFTTGDFATAISPEQETDDFKVYPNPFTNYIRIDNAEKLTRVIVSNIAGQRVMDIESPTNEIRTGNLVTGVYVITLIANDEIVKSERIIKM
ncbi:T9SS type A sorting domain-containing protein [Maribellus sp. YY47]|uniref:T9SS type A sorting domain-containing protein n=1 Tax=Maribellus sp. YY47 TaxID=2929486 RepID=UPI002000DD78|nr:T9SS type A sorting domain-containing protein [Maribellus sp. YY47]MCK3686217.1 T9SS type A sorting domain-containing protein [Maribellus sp. YY47]